MSQAELQTTDSVVSHMLLGFVERKISPQTIADVLRAQILESQASVHFLSNVTCNAILEAITHASATEECYDLVDYLSDHGAFPSCLSFKAAAGTLCTVIKYLHKKNQEPDLDLTKCTGIVEKLSERILQFFHSRQSLNTEDKNNLVRLVKLLNPNVARLLRNHVHFQHLRFMLMAPNDPLQENAHMTAVGVLPQTLEMLRLILKTSDDQLASNTTSYYRTENLGKNTPTRIKHVETMIESFSSQFVSDFKASFTTEWLFERALIDAIFHETTTYDFVTTIKHLVENHYNHIPFMKGFLKALQKDFSFLQKHPDRQNQEFALNFLEQAERVCEVIFPIFVKICEKDMVLVSKHIIPWVLELPVNREESRFFKRSHWRWIRSLAEKKWDASLRDPPHWVSTAGSLYCAAIFHAAPASWIQEFSAPLLERVYYESLQDDMEVKKEHFDYVEFLIRCLRKKSPFFASRSESLYALHLIDRLTRTESLHFASCQARFQQQLSYGEASTPFVSHEMSLWKEIFFNPKIEQELGQSPTSRALAILVNLSKETEKKTVLK